MAEPEENSMMEGFLCPICHKDMRSPNNLIFHFQDTHSEEQDILKSIKGISFGPSSFHFIIFLYTFQIYMAKQKRKS